MKAFIGVVKSQPGVPLRVEVYNQIATAIRAGAFAPDSLLPSEAELGDAMNVSRTVVREAILLLEEDGLVRSRRGIGRFVSADVPPVGYERLKPVEQVFRTRFADLSVHRTETTLQDEAALFTTGHLGLPAASSSWFVESLLISAGEPIALIQEHLPAEDNLVPFGKEIQQAVENVPADRTCFGHLVTDLGVAFGVGRSEVAAGPAGTARGALLGVEATAPVLVVTQTITLHFSAFYLSKVIVLPAAGPLEITHLPGRT